MADGTAKFTLNITNAEGTPATDPNCYVGFQRPDDRIIREARNVAFPPARTFIIPAFPQESNLYCLIKPSLYQLVQSEFFQPNGDQGETVPLQRIPDKWTPGFPALTTLPSPRFDAFQKIVANSTQVDVKHGAVLGRLDATYDKLVGQQQILAKMALL